MKEKAFIGIPEWLKAVEDDDVYATIATLLFEWEDNDTKTTSGLLTKMKEVFGLSAEQAEQAIKLLADNGILKSE